MSQRFGVSGLHIIEAHHHHLNAILISMCKKFEYKMPHQREFVGGGVR